MLVVTPKVTETRAVRGDYVTMLADLQRLLQYVKARFAVMDSGYGPNTSSSQLARLHSPRVLVAFGLRDRDMCSSPSIKIALGGYNRQNEGHHFDAQSNPVGIAKGG